MLWVRQACVRPWCHTGQRHAAHEALHSLAVDPVTASLQIHHHLAAEVEGGESPDLTVEPLRRTLSRYRLWPALALNKTFDLGLDLSLLLADLNWMDAVYLGELVDGLHPTVRLKPHLGLELRLISSSLF